MAQPGRTKLPRIVHQRRDENSRLFAMAFGRYFQRVCRLQMAFSDGDIDLAIIAGAAGLVVAESAMRDPAMRRKYASMDMMLGDQQRGCNALSIAEATGLPRETVRRKMNRLVDMGILARRGVGDYIWQPGVMQTGPYRKLMEEISNETLRLMNECLDDGIFTMETSPS